MNVSIEILNVWGENFVSFAWPMLWQSSLLIIVVFALDFFLARKVRAAVRCALWMVVLVKLLLPPTLALPTGAAWWLWRPAPLPSPVVPVIPNYTVTYGPDVPVTDFVPQPIPMAPPPPKLSGAAWALLASGAMSAALFLWLALRWRRLARKIRRAALSPDFADALEESKQLARLRRRPRLKLVEDSQSPAVYGLFRPVILLPRALAEKLSVPQLRAVLLHEVIHLRRGDIWVHCAQTLLQIIYWWHPLLWLANARIRRAREEAVDDAVMLALRDGADAYAPTLLEVARFAFRRPFAGLGLIGILESRSALRRRIERLVTFRPPRKAGLTFLSLCGIFAFSAVALPMGQGPVSDNNSSAPKTENVQANTGESVEASSTNDLEMRTFKVDTNNFFVNLEKVVGSAYKPPNYVIAPNPARDVSGLAKLFFSRFGLNWNPPKALSYNERRGALFVYATPQDLDIIERNVEILNADPSTIHVEADPPPDDIYRKLDNIHLTVSYRNSPLSEVIRDLHEKSLQLDPNKEGINFLFDPNNIPLTLQSVDDTQIKINLKLNNVPLADVLNEICKASDHLINYSVEDYGVVFSNVGIPQFERRTFKVDPKTFFANVEKSMDPTYNPANNQTIHDKDGVLYVITLNPAQDSRSVAKLFFSQLGLNCNSTETLFFNDRLGEVFVYAAPQDMDIIEKAISALNEAPASAYIQIHIKARFMEVPSRFFADAKNSFPAGVTNGTRILTAAENRTFLHQLESQKGFEILAEPEVTTISGREAKLRATEDQTIITSYAFGESRVNPSTIHSHWLILVRTNWQNWEPNTYAFVYARTGTVETGTILDVAPKVFADGYTIDLRTVASVINFDYANIEHLPPRFVTNLVGKTIGVPGILRTSRDSADKNLFDGQTMILFPKALPPVSLNPDKTWDGFLPEDTRRQNKKNKNTLVVLVTANLIDSAGNRIHTDNEMPFASSTAELTADQAASIARQLANDKAFHLYGSEPFQDGPPARFKDGRWVWEEYEGYGFHATVQFAANGSTNDTDVQFLDNSVQLLDNSIP